MKLRELSALAQNAWEKAIKIPTRENIEAYEAIEDEYRIQLELRRSRNYNKCISNNTGDHIRNNANSNFK